jgi:hypothetical protein
MRFAETDIKYDPNARNTILDYAVTINLLREEDRILSYGKIGNFSITGLEIKFARHKVINPKWNQSILLHSSKI